MAPDHQQIIPCLRCGYDLRGLAIDTVCPECGTAPRCPACGADLAGLEVWEACRSCGFAPGGLPPDALALLHAGALSRLLVGLALVMSVAPLIMLAVVGGVLTLVAVALLHLVGWSAAWVGGVVGLMVIFWLLCASVCCIGGLWLLGGDIAQGPGRRDRAAVNARRWATLGLVIGAGLLAVLVASTWIVSTLLDIAWVAMQWAALFWAPGALLVLSLAMASLSRRALHASPLRSARKCVIWSAAAPALLLVWIGYIAALSVTGHPQNPPSSADVLSMVRGLLGLAAFVASAVAVSYSAQTAASLRRCVLPIYRRAAGRPHVTSTGCLGAAVAFVDRIARRRAERELMP